MLRARTAHEQQLKSCASEHRGLEEEGEMIIAGNFRLK